MNIPAYHPLVSIITPSYNQGRFIEETIQSVLTQDYPHIEYIVIDGGSTDETLDILKKYEGRLTWISEKDKGQADAIHKGFRMARGEIIAWLNSDDTYLPGAVNHVVQMFMTLPVISLVYGKTYHVDEEGHVVGQSPSEPFNLERLAVATYIAQPSTFLTRKVYTAVGGLNLDLTYTMDYDLWMRIALQHFRVQDIPVFLSTYRLHGTSKTIASHHALAFHHEYLQTIMKYFHWAPANRIYGYSYHLVKSTAPSYLVKWKPALVFLALLTSLKEYLKRNRSIRRKDFTLNNLRNLRKLSKEGVDFFRA